MNRIMKFKTLKDDYTFRKDWEKLSLEEFQICFEFIAFHEEMDYNTFAEEVNRMHLSTKGWPVTKNWTAVQRLLVGVAHTEIGFYGYTGGNRWVHPRDRK